MTSKAIGKRYDLNGRDVKKEERRKKQKTEGDELRVRSVRHFIIALGETRDDVRAFSWRRTRRCIREERTHGLARAVRNRPNDGRRIVVG